MELNWAQRQALDATTGALTAGKTKIYVDMPTRTGKTGVFLSVLERMAQEGTLPNTTIVTERRELRHNIMREARKFAPTLIRQGLIKQYTAKTLLATTSPARIKVMTYWGRTRAVTQGLLKPEDESLLIEDEAQHALSSLRLDTHNINPSALHIAFTATPEYSVQKGLPQAGYVPVYELSRQSAIDGHLNAQTRSLVVEMTNTKGNIDMVKKRSGDFSPEELEEIVRQTEVLENIGAFMNTWRSEADPRRIRDRSGFVFCNSISDAISTSAYLNKRFGNNTCAAIWGAMDPKEQLEVIKQHESGAIRFLASADFAIEGLGSARHDVVINKAPSTSAVRVKQRGGRVTGYDPQNPYKEALIVDFIFPSERGDQLTFGDAEGGYLFERSFSGGSLNKTTYAPSKRPMPPINGLVIHDTPEAIEQFLYTRSKKREAAMNEHLKIYTPTIQSAMLRHGVYGRDALWRRIQRFIEETDLEDKDAYLDVKRYHIEKLMRGAASFEDPKTKRYTHAAVLLAAAFGAHPARLFGPLDDESKKPLPPHTILEEDTYLDPEQISIAFETATHAVLRAEKDFLKTGEDYGLDTLESEIWEDTVRMTIEHYPGLADIHADLDALIFAHDKTMEDIIDERRLPAALSRAFEKNLSPREERVIRARFGTGYPPKELQDIACEMSLSTERVRQIVSTAVETIRDSNRSILGLYLPPQKCKGNAHHTAQRRFMAAKDIESALEKQAKTANPDRVLDALSHIASYKYGYLSPLNKKIIRIFLNGYDWDVKNRIEELKQKQNKMEAAISEFLGLKNAPDRLVAAWYESKRALTPLNELKNIIDKFNEQERIKPSVAFKENKPYVSIFDM